jgi:Zn-dependent peptidase ImmA (M78 family)
MVSRDDALASTESRFPYGPEALAEGLGVKVERSPLVGCDGWCITDGSSTIIRLNSQSSLPRQRFTLAHELAHLILGTKPDIVLDEFSHAERTVHSLAAELLLPGSHLRSLVGGMLPVDAECLKRVAKAAHVSETMAACRVAALADELGLVNAAVTAFDEEDKLLWTWAPTLRVPESAAMRLLEDTEKTAPSPYRRQQNDGKVVVASLLPARNIRILFMQLLPPQLASQKSVGERRRELDQFLFAGNGVLRGKVAGSLGAFKSKRQANSLSIAEALRVFNETYTTTKWLEPFRSHMLTNEGQEFLALYLEPWCRRD